MHSTWKKTLCFEVLFFTIGIAVVVSAVDVYVTCDESCDVFVDGEVVDRAISSSRLVRLPPTARLVAVKATQTGDPTTGYIEMWPDYDVSNPQPYISDPVWKCSHEEQPGWANPRFDETDWAHAAIVTSYTGPRGERRIWSSTQSWTAFCRFWLPNEAKCYASAVADKIKCAANTIHQGECEHRGCCFQDTGVGFIPKCYYVLNVLPVATNEPIVSDKVPRTYTNFGLVRTAGPSAARDGDNALVGAYRQGTPKTCFRACLLTSCKSMYYHDTDGSCIMYKQQTPMLLSTGAGWSFYESAGP